MPQSRNNALAKNLLTILQGSSALDALAVVSMDGTEIASAIPENINAERFSAMSLAIFTLGDQIATELERHTLQEIYIRGKHGFIILMQLDRQALLVGLAQENARPGLALLELHHAAKSILEIKRKLQQSAKTPNTTKSPQKNKVTNP